GQVSLKTAGNQEEGVSFPSHSPERSWLNLQTKGFETGEPRSPHFDNERPTG
ncbi:hypothetical protein STEG23_004705, partial [Scotinomys teguina]